MATTQAKAANPKKKSGFQGVQAAIWIIVICFILAVCFYKFVLGNPANFVDGNPENAVKDGSLLGLDHHIAVHRYRTEHRALARSPHCIW